MQQSYKKQDLYVSTVLCRVIQNPTSKYYIMGSVSHRLTTLVTLRTILQEVNVRTPEFTRALLLTRSTLNQRLSHWTFLWSVTISSFVIVSSNLMQSMLHSSLPKVNEHGCLPLAFAFNSFITFTFQSKYIVFILLRVIYKLRTTLSYLQALNTRLALKFTMYVHFSHRLASADIG